jgi:hypothetical protein
MRRKPIAMTMLKARNLRTIMRFTLNPPPVVFTFQILFSAPCI